MKTPRFQYITYIYGEQVTPQKVFAALTERPHLDVYMQGTGPKSTWEVGAKVFWKSLPEDEFDDLDQEVLEVIPGEKLRYSWHQIQEMHRGLFNSEADFQAALPERSVVTFYISELSDGLSGSRLELVHDGFDSDDSVMLQGVTEGWSMILSSLKTYLEQ